MPKIGGDKPADIAVMSEQMQKSLKEEIAKFGFQPYKFDEFLISVKAARIDEKYKNLSMMCYPISEMEKYRIEYIRKHEHGLNDAFMLEKWAKRDNEFMPVSFWEKVRDL